MKKIILFVAMMMFCGVARAESLSILDTFKKVPALNQGVGYSLIDNKINYLTTFDIAKKWGFSLEAGYAGAAENTGDKLVAVLSYDILNLKDKGVTLPILDLIDLRVGLYAGAGRIEVSTGQQMKSNNEWDAGVSATAISIKF